MNEIITLLACLEQNLDATTMRQLSRVAGALLAMTGRVTMLGMSRWAGKGGSYRTVQRLFNRVLPWGQLLWLLFRTHLYCWSRCKAKTQPSSFMALTVMRYHFKIGSRFNGCPENHSISGIHCSRLLCFKYSFARAIDGRR